MEVRGRKRQRLLFLFAIVIPACVLLTFAGLIVRQETELADKRAGDERRQALEQLRRELSTRLDAIKLQELTLLGDDPAAAFARREPESPVVFVARLDQDRLVMPWETAAKPWNPSAEFSRYQREGETAEFIANDLPAAIAGYRLALRNANRVEGRCRAQLWLARTLAKSKKAEAADIFHAMMKHCGSVTDDDGVPYALYAASQVSDSQSYVLEQADQIQWRHPAQAWLLRSLLPAEAKTNLDLLIRDIGQMTALARDFRGSMFRMEFPFTSRMNGLAWLAYGEELWLITVMEAAPQSAPVVLAVSSQKVAPPGATLVATHTESSVSLGEGFVDLEVDWAPGRFTGNAGVPARLYAIGLALILGATGLAGYLLLRDVNRQIELADMRSQFVASVSHELKTPLTAIRMLAETMDMGRSKDPEKQSQYLQTIVNESERLSRLVDNVLDFSRIERGKKIYQLIPTPLADVVHSVAQTMQYSLAQNGFQLDTSIDDSLPPALADRDAMEQAILNLLTNAMKYSGTARSIYLSLRRDGGDAAIEVKDRGVGIPASDHAKIFEKFYRVPSANTELVAGTGLGLTLTQHIVKAHGGRIQVKSVPCKGSTFTILLPLVENAR